MSVFALLAVLATPLVASAATLTWSGDATTAWEPHVVSTESKITHITLAMSNIAKGEFMDYCVYLSRDSGPFPYTAFTGGFSEIACWSLYYRGSAGNWSYDVDLSQIPLYIPAGTSITCEGHLLTAAGQAAGRRTCTITTAPYNTGDARYRIFRLPYIDQQIKSTIPFLTPY